MHANIKTISCEQCWQYCVDQIVNDINILHPLQMNIKFTAIIFNVLFLNLVLGQAPGDFSLTCRTHFRYRGFHDWIPYVNDTAVGVRGDVKWQVIVDQFDYENILGEGVLAGVWTARDFDGGGGQVNTHISRHGSWY